MKPVLDDRWSAESFEDYSIKTSEVWEKEGEEFRINIRWGGGVLFFFCKKKPVVDGDLINEFRETGSLPPPTADVTEEMQGSGITDLAFSEGVDETQKPLLLNAVSDRGRQGGDASKKSLRAITVENSQCWAGRSNITTFTSLAMSPTFPLELALILTVVSAQTLSEAPNGAPLSLVDLASLP